MRNQKKKPKKDGSEIKSIFVKYENRSGNLSRRITRKNEMISRSKGFHLLPEKRMFQIFLCV